MRTNIRRHRPAATNRVSAWLLHHLQSMIFSLGKIYQAPATTIMTVSVIGITLSLPGGFYLFLKNINAISGDFRSTTQISLFLDLGVREDRARALEKEIAGMDNVESTRFISREQSLEEFRRDSGFGKSIDTLSS
ncbi:MAG: permease-like cell division protein FtsX, partial [Gammaproteobacteria bacterium]